MTSPINNWFSLSIRRERKSFIFASLILIATLLTVVKGIDLLDISSRVKTILLFAYMILGVAASHTLSAQRLRDMGVTGWLALAWIPINFSNNELRSLVTSIFILVLWTVPGSRGKNIYGDSPIDGDAPAQ